MMAIFSHYSDMRKYKSFVEKHHGFRFKNDVDVKICDNISLHVWKRLTDKERES